MTHQGTCPDVFLQAEAAIAELEREVTDYKTWARDWADEVRAGAAADEDDEDAVPEASAPAAGWVNPEASAVGVASFWANYHPPEPAEPESDAAVPPEPMLDATADLAVAGVPKPDVEPAAPDANVGDEVGDVQDAMKAALVAAYEELHAPDEPVLVRADASVSEPDLAPLPDEAPAVPSYGDDLTAKPLPTEDEQADAEPAQSAGGDELLADVDAATAGKLKMLRRLNPGASVAELLERIQAEDDSGSAPGRKKRWFGRK